MKNDREVSLGCTVAYGMWGIAGALFIGVMIFGDARMCGALFFAIGVATTATVRTYFVAFSTMVRKAFEAEAAPVRSIR